ncbi:hypothetical protein [Acinetobacter johnsonii]|uniref:hypothetical protein n=1 Tax=Acinetobacter johnsonii TaxID=40214 RepID=UPI003AF64FF3
MKKRINQYALLKTNSVKINIFLMLSIISGANNLPEKIENIAKTLYKMGNGQDLMNFQRLSNSEIKLIEKTISKFFAIEAYEYITFLEQVKNIYSRHRNTVSPDPQPKIQSELTQLYCKYSIQPLATYSDISGQFELYLKANLWDENNIEESK